jgi:myo-inositol-1(or 4)-monophosphatase
MYPASVSHFASQIESIVAETAAFIRSAFGKVNQDEIEVKELNSLVSFVDKNAEEMLVSKLSALLPNSTFITEEQTVAQQKSEQVWIIDPLDGTTNFLYGIPHFSISVALQEHGVLKTGIVYDVMRKECFMAFANKGAFLNGEKINVSANTTLKAAVLATGFPYKRVDIRLPFGDILNYFLKEVRAIRRMGSAALDLAYVACGRFDGYYECCLNPWDVAAGILLVQEAGGAISDFKGGSDFSDGEQIIAASKHMHPEILSGVKAKLALDL